MSKQRSFYLLCLSLCLITGVIYFRAAFLPFCILDDKEYVTTNVYVLKGLSLTSITWAFTSFHAGNWHPLTWISLMMDSQLFGMTPMGFHVVNVLLHIATSALLFLLLNSVTGAMWRSAIVAVLFAVHPAHVESVAWITERKDVLSGFFCMLTLLCYSRYVKQGALGMYLAALGMYALGLMAKPMLVTMPVMLLLFDYWPLQRLRLARSTAHETKTADEISFSGTGKILWEKLPFLVLSVLSSVVTLYAQRSIDAIIPLEHISLFDRIGNALLSYAVYVKMLILPTNLAVFYQFTPVQAWKTFCIIPLLAVILFLLYRNKTRLPYMATGTVWYLVTLLPVIGLIQVGVQAMADRYTYIPSIGLFIVASWGGADVAARFPQLRKIIFAFGGAAVLAYAIATSLQLSYWKNNVTLFSHALAVTPVKSSLAHARLGLAYLAEGRPDLSVEEFEVAMKIDPGATEINLLLGTALDRIGRTAEAIEHFKEVIRLHPRLAAGHSNLAFALQKSGKLPDAVAEYNAALAIKPDDASCHDKLGLALLQMGRIDEAIQHFSEAVRLNPTLIQTSMDLQYAISQRNQNAH